MTADPEAFREHYINAYCKANPGKPQPNIWYCGGGWYGIQSEGTPLSSSFRRTTIIEMTERLKSRVPA